MYLITVRFKADFRFKSVVEIFKFSFYLLLKCLWRIVRYKLLCRNKSKIIYKKFRDSKGILGVRNNGKLLCHNTGFKKHICIAFDEIVVIIFMLINDIFDLFFIYSCKLTELTQEFTCFISSDRKCRIMKIGGYQAFFSIFFTFPTDTQGDTRRLNSAFGIRSMFLIPR